MTAFAGLIAEEAALHALQYGCTHGTSHRLFQAKGAADYQPDDSRELRNVEHNDDHGQQDVAHRHEGHHHTGEMGDAAHTAEDDEQGGHGEGNTHMNNADARCIAQGITKGIALYHLIGNAKGDRDKHGEEHSHPLAVQSALHIIGRTAIERFLATALV